MDRLRAQWGFHPGGWGKPPLDEYNRPLYGDVFGVLPKNADADVSGINPLFKTDRRDDYLMLTLR